MNKSVKLVLGLGCLVIALLVVAGVACVVILAVRTGSHEATPVTATQPEAENHQSTQEIPLPTELVAAEQELVHDFGKCAEASAALLSEIRRLRPPTNKTYAHADLLIYNRMLDELYKKYPEYKTKINMPSEAEEVASITGLDTLALGRYQLAYGTYGLRDITFAVSEIPHRRWVTLYFVLIGVSVRDGAAMGAVIDNEAPSALREAYQLYRKTKAAAESQVVPLIEKVYRAIAEQPDPRTRCRLHLKKSTYKILAKDIGRGDALGRDSAEYPALTASREYFRESDRAAEITGIPFGELAYVQKEDGRYGLAEALEKCDGLDDLSEFVKTLR
jgi:hypothetical protein